MKYVCFMRNFYITNMVLIDAWQWNYCMVRKITKWGCFALFCAYYNRMILFYYSSSRIGPLRIMDKNLPNLKNTQQQNTTIHFRRHQACANNYLNQSWLFDGDLWNSL